MLINRLLKKNPDNKFLKIMANNKIRSIIFLSFWIIFIIIVCFIAGSISQKENNSINNNVVDNKIEEIKNDTKTFSELKEELLKDNYSFTFTKTGDNKVICKGDSLNKEKTGYKETNEGIIKYYINDDKYYYVENGVLVETEKENIYEESFDLNIIFDKISNINPIINNDSYVFENETIYVKILLDDNHISSIEVNNDIRLEFYNINKLEQINY